MLGIKVNLIKMNFRRIFTFFFVFIITSIITESYKKLNIEDPNYNEIKENRENIKRNSFSSNQQILESEFNMKQKLYSKSRTEIVDLSKEKNLINFGNGSRDILFVSTLGIIHI